MFITPELITSPALFGGGAERLSGGKQPETENFDFLKYLLGLQGFTPETFKTTSSQLSLQPAVPTPKDEELLALLGKRDEDTSAVVLPASPMFPNIPSPIKDPEVPPLADLAYKNYSNIGSFGGGHEENPFEPKLTSKSDEKPMEPRQPAEWQAVSREVAIQKYGDLFPAMRLVQTPLPVPRHSDPVDLFDRADRSDWADWADRADRIAEPISVMNVSRYLGQEPGEKLKTEDENKTLSEKSSLSLAIGHSGSVRGTEAQAGTEPDKVQLTPPAELLKTVQTLSHHGGGKMVVSLYPPDLGHVEVSVTTRGNLVEIKMTPENQAAKSIIESGLADLKHAMQAQDLVVSRLEVNLAKPGTFEGGISWLSADAHSQRFDGFRESQREPQLHRGKTPRIDPIAVASITARACASGRLDVRI